MPVHVGAVFHLELMALPPVETVGGGHRGNRASFYMDPHALFFPGRMTCHPNAPPLPRHSMLTHPHRRTTPSPPPTPTTAATGMTPRPTMPQTPSPASATATTPASPPSPAQGARVLALSTPTAATPPRLPLRRWW